jgi:hypothetical protein
MNHPSASLFVDPRVCVLDARNPAASHWNLETFSSLEHVIREPPNAAESDATRVLREAGLAIKVGVSRSSLRSLPDLVRATNRVAVIQGRLALGAAGLQAERGLAARRGIPGRRKPHGALHAMNSADRGRHATFKAMGHGPRFFLGIVLMGPSGAARRRCLSPMTPGFWIAPTAY